MINDNRGLRASRVYRKGVSLTECKGTKVAEAIGGLWRANQKKS